MAKKSIKIKDVEEKLEKVRKQKEKVEQTYRSLDIQEKTLTNLLEDLGYTQDKESEDD